MGDKGVVCSVCSVCSPDVSTLSTIHPAWCMKRPCWPSFIAGAWGLAPPVTFHDSNILFFTVFCLFASGNHFLCGVASGGWRAVKGTRNKEKRRMEALIESHTNSPGTAVTAIGSKWCLQIY